METYRSYTKDSIRKLTRNHIYVKLHEILSDKFPQYQEREKIVDRIYKLFEEMV